MDSIEQHIEKDKEILQDPNRLSSTKRRHIEGELHDLEEYVEHHKEEISKQEIITIQTTWNYSAIKNLQPRVLIYDD